MREHLKSFLDKSRTPHVRGLRILLEYFYATEIFEPMLRDQIRIISVFGSARAHEGTSEYKEAYKLGKALYRQGFAVVTGASCGIMQAANQGVADEIADALVRIGKEKTREAALASKAYMDLLRKFSVGLKITLPFEPKNNPYLGVHATFHYFMVRKFFFGTLSSGFIACEGGWGTRDELYEILTLVQTGKSPLMPIVYISSNPRHLMQDLEHTVKKGYIHPEDLHLIQVVKTATEAAKIVDHFYRRLEKVEYRKDGIVRLYLKQPLKAPHRKTLETQARRWRPFLGNGRFTSRYIEFTQFPYISFGYLRQFIDIVNR